MRIRLFRLLIRVPIALYLFGLLTYIITRFTIGDNFWLLAWMNNFAPYYFVLVPVVMPVTYFLKSKPLNIASISLGIFALFWFLPNLIPDNLFKPLPTFETSLTVVTFNVWGGNQQLDNVISWLETTDADVVLLQEIPSVWAGDGIEELKSLYPYQMSQPLEERLAGDAILSRHPIVAHEKYDLQNGYLANDRIEIDVNGHIVAIYNLHLYWPQTEQLNFQPPIDNSFVNMLAKYDDTARNRQIEELLPILADEEMPFVVGGDFNMSDNAVTYTQLSNQLTDSFRQAGVGFGATWPNPEILNLPTMMPAILRIDYIWHSDEWMTTEVWVGPRLGSDHLPLVAKLILK